jgi:hypothetical protein
LYKEYVPYYFAWVTIEVLLQAYKPPETTKWLMVVHNPESSHWTLLELRWQHSMSHYYDSLLSSGESDAGMERTERLACRFLMLLEGWLGWHTDPQSWSWTREQVRLSLNILTSCIFLSISFQRQRRQANGYNCGPFVAADLASLAVADLPSSLTQSEMGDWRAEMLLAVRSCDLKRSDDPKNAPGPSQEIFEVDADD